MPPPAAAAASGSAPPPGGQFSLPARLDLPAAAPLAEALRARLGSPLTLDATACTCIGTPGLQVLLSAARSWREAGLALSLVGLSESCREQIGHFGLSPDDLGSEAAAP